MLEWTSFVKPADAQEKDFLRSVESGCRLRRLDQSEEAIALFADLLRRCEPQTSQLCELVVLESQLQKGKAHEDLGQQEEAQACFDAALAVEEREDTRMNLARALYAKAELMMQLDQIDDARQLYQQVVARYQGTTEDVILALVAESLFAQGMLFDEVGEYEKELPFYEQLIALCLESDHLDVLSPLAEGMMQKAYVLTELERSKEAREAYNAVIKRFANATDEELNEHVEKARELKSEL